jgi:hypothetical protein
VQTTSVAIEPVNTALRIGDNQASLGFAGRMDMAAALSVNIYGTTPAARELKAMTFDMLGQLYGDAVAGLVA